MKENWKIIYDGIHSSIEKTDEEVDDTNVFSTFSQAKKTMIEDFQSQIRDYKEAVKRARTLRKDQIKHRREIYE